MKTLSRVDRARRAAWRTGSTASGIQPVRTFDGDDMAPTIGRTVHYVLSADDVKQINRRRTNGGSIAERIKQDPPAWPEGAQAHIGNPASEGATVPLVITAVWPNEFGQDVPGVNGQALLDGNDVLWITSAKEGTEPGTWAWPPRV